MRILFVHELFGFFGGVEQNVFDTATTLRARGHQCYLTCRARTGREEQRFATAFDETSMGWTSASPTRVEITELIKAWRCDVLYAHKIADSQFIDRGLVARTVRAIHDHDATCPRRHKYYARSGRSCSQPMGLRCYADLAFLDRRGIDLKRIERTKTEVRRLGRYDRVIANSRSMADELTINGVPREIVEVIHPVVPESPEPTTPVPSVPHILYVGQLIRGKGVDLLLRALAKLDETWQLSIVGTGNMQSEIEALVEALGLLDRVRLLGWVPSGCISSLYDEARVVAMPIRWPEPFGMVGIEAMRRGRPVVAFGLGGVCDWLDNGVTGYQVAEQDLAGFADAVSRLLTDDSLAQRMGDSAAKSARERFGFTAYIDKLEKALEGMR